jgi:hypothetical protein
VYLKQLRLNPPGPSTTCRVRLWRLLIIAPRVRRLPDDEAEAAVAGVALFDLSRQLQTHNLKLRNRLKYQQVKLRRRMYGRTNHYGPREDREEANGVDEGEAQLRITVDDVDEDGVMIQRL